MLTLFPKPNAIVNVRRTKDDGTYHRTAIMPEDDISGDFMSGRGFDLEDAELDALRDYVAGNRTPEKLAIRAVELAAREGDD